MSDIYHSWIIIICGINTQNSIKANILYSQYITSVHQEPTLMRKNKCSNINVGNIPCNIFYGEAVFPSGNLTLNVGYLFHILLVFMCQLKLVEKLG